MIIIFKNLIFLLFLCPFLILANTSINPDIFSPKNGRIILTVAIEETGYFPYNYEENGKIKGFTIDVLDYIEAHSKYDFEFVILPWPRALYLVEKGKVDLILTLFKNKQREKLYHFIEPSYGYEVNQLFSLTDNKFEFSGQLHQLSSFSIGTKREFSYGETFDKAKYLTKLPVLTEEVLLKLLLSERIDMAISNPYFFNKLILKYNVSNEVKAIWPYIDKTPVYLGLTKGRDDALEIKQTFGQLTEQLKA
ncbi:MAG: polar amino acid transport system substrate-binding protein [Colwellia sp.]|jgi:polar amino acid transport system substrate-binding protein